MLSAEDSSTYDRTDLTKGLLKYDLKKETLRSPEFYRDLDIDLRLKTLVKKVDSQ